MSGVGLHPIGPTVQCAAKLLPWTNECQRNHQKEEPAQDLHRNGVTRQTLTVILGAKIDILRRRLIGYSDTLHKRTAADFPRMGRG